MKKLRVLQLGKFFPIMGGVEKVMYELVTGLPQQGVQCDMLTASNEGAGLRKELQGGSCLYICRTWLKVYGTMISPSEVSLLRKICNQYDIIHIHHPDPMAALSLYLSGYKGKVVLHWHSDIIKQKHLLKIFLPLQRWLLKRADKIIGTTPTYVANSPYLASVPEEKKCIVPIGINVLPAAVEAAEKIRQYYKGRKIILSIGRLVPYKGHKYLIDAALHLDDSYVILIVGKGPLKEILRTQIREQSLEQRVELLGYIPDSEIAAYFRACTLFCLPSIQKTEAFGIVQIEAMSCAKPVIATNIQGSGTTWVNAHGVSGLNVEPCNAFQLAQAIRTLTENETTYQEYSRQARMRYEELFTKEKMIKNLLEIYNKL